MNWKVHVSMTMWRFKNQPSNFNSCIDNALRFLILVTSKLYRELQMTSSFSIWGCVLRGYFERGIFWRAHSCMKGIEDFNIEHWLYPRIWHNKEGFVLSNTTRRSFVLSNRPFNWSHHLAAEQVCQSESLRTSSNGQLLGTTPVLMWPFFLQAQLHSLGTLFFWNHEPFFFPPGAGALLLHGA
jgi:hypothetical protein